MLPRPWMLTIKNRATILLGTPPGSSALAAILLLAAVVWVAGCTPPGPRAFLEGKRLLDKGDLAQAVEKLKAAASLLDTNALAWNCLGVACHRSGQQAEAEAAYK